MASNDSAASASTEPISNGHIYVVVNESPPPKLKDAVDKRSSKQSLSDDSEQKDLPEKIAETSFIDGHKKLQANTSTGSTIHAIPDPPPAHGFELEEDGCHKRLEKVNSANGKVANVQIIEVFDEKAEKYQARACCECMHVKYGAVVVGILQAIMIGGWIALAAWYYLKIAPDGFIPPFLYHLIGIVIATGILIVHFWGIATERPYLMLPHLVVEMIGIAAGVLLTLVAVVCMSISTQTAVTVFGAMFGNFLLKLAQNNLGPIWPFVLAVIFDTGAAVGIWFHNVTQACYVYLCDKKYHESGCTAKFIWHPASTKGEKGS